MKKKNGKKLVEKDKIMFVDERIGVVMKLELIVETVAQRKNEEQFMEEGKIVIVGEKTGADEKSELFVAAT